MTQSDILNELRKFSVVERLKFVEQVLDLVREDLQGSEAESHQTSSNSKLAAAAQALLPDYAAKGELTIFTTLDSEEVDETR
jgi:hypothetical protein